MVSVANEKSEKISIHFASNSSLIVYIFDAAPPRRTHPKRNECDVARIEFVYIADVLSVFGRVVNELMYSYDVNICVSF